MRSLPAAVVTIALCAALGCARAAPAAPGAPGGGPVPATPAAAKKAASGDSAELAAFKKAIRAKYDLKEKAFAEHDAETIVSQFYAADVISVGEGEGIYIGRDQIRPLYEDVVKDNTVKVDSVYTYVNGDAGWDWADFKVFPADPHKKPFTFAILFLWTKVGGSWICKGDFFVNGSLRGGKLQPPAASQESGAANSP